MAGCLANSTQRLQPYPIQRDVRPLVVGVLKGPVGSQRGIDVVSGVQRCRWTRAHINVREVTTLLNYQRLGTLLACRQFHVFNPLVAVCASERNVFILGLQPLVASSSHCRRFHERWPLDSCQRRRQLGDGV